MANITGDGNFTAKQNQASQALIVGILKFISALNVFLSITAFLGNVLILVALHKVTSIHPPTKCFFRCLAVTDLCVGLIVQPLFATIILRLSRVTKVSGNVVYSTSFYLALSLIVCGISVLTTTAISADRLLALLLGLRYRHVVTIKRVRVVIICLWFIGASLGCLVIISIDIALKGGSAFVLFCFLISIFCHSKIFFKLRHQQAQVQNHVSQRQAIPLNIARYNKSVSSILCVQLALVACYAPWGINVVLYLNGEGNYVSLLVTETLTLINSSLNPIMYCWRIRALREAVKDTIRQLKCNLSN